MDRRSFLKKLPVLGIVPYIGPGIRLPEQEEQKTECGYWEMEFEYPEIQVTDGLGFKAWKPISAVSKCKVRLELNGGAEILIGGEKFTASWFPPENPK